VKLLAFFFFGVIFAFLQLNPVQFLIRIRDRNTACVANLRTITRASSLLSFSKLLFICLDFLGARASAGYATLVLPSPQLTDHRLAEKLVGPWGNDPDRAARIAAAQASAAERRDAASPILRTARGPMGGLGEEVFKHFNPM
jgi:hypothetical protein